FAKDLGLEYLTVYAFSTENWKRPEDEVRSIMGLLEKYLHEAIDRMARDRVKMAFFGDLSPLSPKLLDLCRQTQEISKAYDGCQMNISLNYGGRDELVGAAKAFDRNCEEGRANQSSLYQVDFRN